MGGFEWKKTYRSKARCHPKASLHTLRYCLIFLRCVFAHSELNLTTHNYYAIQRVGIWEGATYFFIDLKGIVSSTMCCRTQKKACGKEDAKLCWRFDAGILPLTLHRSGFTLQNNAVHQNAWVGDHNFRSCSNFMDRIRVATEKEDLSKEVDRWEGRKCRWLYFRPLVRAIQPCFSQKLFACLVPVFQH